MVNYLRPRQMVVQFLVLIRHLERLSEVTRSKYFNLETKEMIKIGVFHLTDYKKVEHFISDCFQVVNSCFIE